jgi:hypothetical protein
MWRRRSSTIDSRSPSPGSSATGASSLTSTSLNGTTADDDGLAPGNDVVGALASPFRRHVLVLDSLLEQDDPLQ